MNVKRSVEVETELLSTLEHLHRSTLRLACQDVVLKAEALLALLDSVILLMEERIAKTEEEKTNGS